MKDPNDIDWITRISSFESAAHEILAQYEGSQSSRVIKLDKTYSTLSILNLKQDELFRQSLRCVEGGLYGAAHVMCWAACMDFIHEKINDAGMPAIQLLYPKWPKVQNAVELAEYVPEYQLVESLRKLGITGKTTNKALLSLLDRRNECAHPTNYHPGVNETLGYITECLNRIEALV